MAVARKQSSGGGSGSGSQIVKENVSCDSGVAVGNWVYLDASGVAQIAQADDIDTSLAVGVVQSKPTSVTCNIVMGGVTSGIFSSLDPTKPYFLSHSTPGAMTQTVPTGSNQVVLGLGSPLSATEFIVDLGIRILLT